MGVPHRRPAHMITQEQQDHMTPHMTPPQLFTQFTLFFLFLFFGGAELGGKRALLLTFFTPEPSFNHGNRCDVT